MSLRNETLALLRRLGVTDAAFAPEGLPARSPITGETHRHAPRWTERPRPAPPSAAPCEAFRAMAQGPGAAPRRIRPAARRGTARRTRPISGCSSPSRPARSSSEGLGEVQEMIDICDFRRRPVAPALRPHHRHRAPRPPDDGDLAPARRLRRHHRLQLPRRGLVLERRARLRLRQPSRLEALGKDAAHGARRAGRRRARRREVRRRSRGICRGPDRRRAMSARRSSTITASPSISATGSTAMGRQVGPRARRPLRAAPSSNSAATMPPSSRPRADLDLALRAIAFAAMGTAGQRCTTLRRLIVHESVYDTLVPKLKKVYCQRPRRRSARARRARRPADRQGCLRRHGAARSARPAPWAASVHGGEREHASASPDAYYVAPGPGRDAGA